MVRTHNTSVHKHDLVDTTEMYLRTILELEEEGVPPLRARIAERLHQSGPTVSQTVARMERDGLLTVENDRHLLLTEEGRVAAVAVMRKHRLAELLLVNVIGMPYEEAHEEACRWEHVMSDSVERYQRAYRADPTCRGDPQMLEDLLKAVTHRAAGRTAARAIRDIYGAEALPALEKAIARGAGNGDANDSLDHLRDSLSQ